MTMMNQNKEEAWSWDLNHEGKWWYYTNFRLMKNVQLIIITSEIRESSPFVSDSFSWGFDGLHWSSSSSIWKTLGVSCWIGDDVLMSSSLCVAAKDDRNKYHCT